MIDPQLLNFLSRFTEQVSDLLEALRETEDLIQEFEDRNFIAQLPANYADAGDLSYLTNAKLAAARDGFEILKLAADDNDRLVWASLYEIVK